MSDIVSLFLLLLLLTFSNDVYLMPVRFWLEITCPLLVECCRCEWCGSRLPVMHSPSLIVGTNKCRTNHQPCGQVCTRCSQWKQDCICKHFILWTDILLAGTHPGLGRDVPLETICQHFLNCEKIFHFVTQEYGSKLLKNLPISAVHPHIHITTDYPPPPPLMYSNRILTCHCEPHVEWSVNYWICTKFHSVLGGGGGGALAAWLAMHLCPKKMLKGCVFHTCNIIDVFLKTCVVLFFYHNYRGTR